MKKNFLLLTLLVLLFFETSAFATTRFVDITGTDSGDCSLNPCKTISYALGQSIDGDIINISVGNYTLTNTLYINKKITLLGVDKNKVIINSSLISSGYGIQVASSDVSLLNFTLIGPKSHTNGYGIFISGVSNIQLKDLIVRNSGRSGINFNGCNNVLLENIQSSYNNGTGIGISDSKNFVLRNIITNNNNWSGMAIFTSGQYYAGGCDNILLEGTNSFSEIIPLYAEISNYSGGPDYPITNLNVSNDFKYIVRFPIIKPKVVVFYPNLNTALNNASLAVSLGAVDAVVNKAPTQIPSDDYGTFYVGPGMKIQSAINNATNGNTISVRAGNYSETIKITKPLTLRGAQAGNDARTRTTTQESIIISNDTNGAIQVQAGSGQVVINGFKIINAVKAIHVNGITNNVIVRNNIVENSSIDAVNLWRAKNAIVEYNYVNGAGTSGITAGDDNGTSVENDGVITKATITNNKVVNAKYGITGYQKSSVIENNEVIGNVALVYGAGIGGQFYNTTIRYNNVSGYSSGAGVAFNPYPNRANSYNVSVLFNNIYNNFVGLFSNQTLNGKNIFVNYNYIFNNNNGGVNLVNEYLNAEYNWWGDSSGPYDGSDDRSSGGLYNPSGLGNDVTDYIDYDPWLKQNDALCLETNIPNNMIVGRTYPISIKMKNIGINPWTKTDNYKLGSQNPQDNTIWGLNRVEILDNTQINFLEDYTFNFVITAPTSPGTYDCDWQMVKEYVAWFGETCRKQVNVVYNCVDNDNDGYYAYDAVECPSGNDCDDNNAAVNPGVTEICGNGIDDNCDGQVDEENALGCVNYYFDNDNDGFGINDYKCLCLPAEKYTATQNSDCDDTNPNVNPEVKEICDGIDNNCNSQIDEGCLPPRIKAFRPMNNSLTNNNRPHIWATYETNSGFKECFAKLDNVEITAQSSCSNFYFDYWPNQELSDGTHKVYLKVVDVNGMFSEAVWSFKVDTTGPTISINNPENNKIYNNQRLLLNVNIGEKATRIEYSINDYRWNYLCRYCNSYSGYINFVEGNNNLKIRAYDSLGNYNTAQINFNVDSQKPFIYSTTPRSGTRIYATPTSLFSMSYSEASVKEAKFYYKIGNQDWNSIDLTSNCQSGKSKTCSATLDLSDVSKGTKINYYFTIKDYFDRTTTSTLATVTIQ
ncbi:MAG: MopE-related protein [Candidatus Woesearchaeota archaeon]